MSENVNDTSVSKEELVADMKTLIGQYTKVTRDFYRSQGSFSEAAWSKHFPTFKSFIEAAVGNTTPTEAAKYIFTDTTGEILLDKTTIHTLDELLEYCKVDLSIWKVERFIVNKWEMGYTRGPQVDKTAHTKELYQVKATLVKKEEIVAARQELESLKHQAESLALIPTPIIRTNRKTGNMLEIALFDSHFGKLAWHRETGATDYDIKIAQATFLEAVEQLLDRAKGYEFDSVLFIVGNDLLHSDNLSNQTTKGTLVDCDSRYQKTFELVRETITKCIERFRTIAPVTVKMVQGNHDELSVWHLGDSLSCLFKNYTDVTIDNEPIQRKYHQWGNNGLMFVHGHTGKRSDYPLLFATERPDIFGNTKYREIHTGHNHQTKTEEFHGVRVRIIPSLSPADSWHSSMGFTGQQRVGEAYVFNREKGLIAQFYYNADN